MNYISINLSDIGNIEFLYEQNSIYGVKWHHHIKLFLIIFYCLL